jgi:hypothetical protein
MTDNNAWIKIKNSENILLKDNKTDGSRPFLEADQVKHITIDGNELNYKLTDGDIDEIKKIIFKDVEEKLKEVNGKNGTKVIDVILQFLSNTSSAALIGYIKSRGLN